MNPHLFVSPVAVYQKVWAIESVIQRNSKSHPNVITLEAILK